MKEKVSIIVPIYNVEKYLNKCINSLVNQTYINLEIILVNDGSPDNSLLICEKFEKTDERIIVIDKKNGGLSDARNFGLEKATGEYILFLDSDDYLEKDAIQILVEYITKYQASVVLFGYYVDYLNENEEILKSVDIQPDYQIYTQSNINEIELDLKMIGLLGYAWNKLYKHELIKHLRFKKGISLVEDSLFNSEALINFNKMIFLNKSFIHYNQRDVDTLGTIYYENYLQLKDMSYHSLENLFDQWKLKKENVKKIMKLLKFNNHKIYIKSIVESNDLSNEEKYNLISDSLILVKESLTLELAKILSFKDKVIFNLMKYNLVKVLIYIYERN